MRLGGNYRLAWYNMANRFSWYARGRLPLLSVFGGIRISKGYSLICHSASGRFVDAVLRASYRAWRADNRTRHHYLHQARGAGQRSRLKGRAAGR